MTATGKITASYIRTKPLGTVRVLVTDHSDGRTPASDRPAPGTTWYPAKTDKGMRAATVTEVERFRDPGMKISHFRLTTDIGMINPIVGAHTFLLAPEQAPTVDEVPHAKPSGEEFDPSCVTIERHRASVTQGEVSVFYLGELLGRYGDQVRLCTDQARDHGGAICFGSFCGRPDQYWIEAAAWALNHRSARPIAEPAATIQIAPNHSKAAVDPAGITLERVSVRELLNRTAVGRVCRVLITDGYEYRGGGAGTWRAATAARRTSSTLMVKRAVPIGVFPATVERVEHVPDTGRYNVVTNLGTVEGCVLAQMFQVPPASEPDTVAVRAELAAHRAEQRARQERGKAHPRDVNGVSVAPGDLVEAVCVNIAMRPGLPGLVFRVLRPSPVAGLIVPMLHQAGYGDYADGEGTLITFRRLADQTERPTAVRSCGCPAPVRSEIAPRPPHADRYWHVEARERDEVDSAHRPSCHWADEPDKVPGAYQAFMVTADDGTIACRVHHQFLCDCGDPRIRDCAPVPVSDYDQAGIVESLFPTRAYPDRGELPPVEFAGCCNLPAVSERRAAYAALDERAIELGVAPYRVAVWSGGDGCHKAWCRRCGDMVTGLASQADADAENARHVCPPTPVVRVESGWRQLLSKPRT